MGRGGLGRTNGLQAERTGRTGQDNEWEVGSGQLVYCPLPGLLFHTRLGHIHMYTLECSGVVFGSRGLGDVGIFQGRNPACPTSLRAVTPAVLKEHQVGAADHGRTFSVCVRCREKAAFLHKSPIQLLIVDLKAWSSEAKQSPGLTCPTFPSPKLHPTHPPPSLSPSLTCTHTPNPSGYLCFPFAPQ